jgi:GDPmannose 4,6-dehydratase
MLQAEEPGDYVLATGETTTVRAFARLAFEAAGIELAFEGTGEQEKGYDRETGRCRVEVDPRYYRPTEVDLLLGDAQKARQALGWQPTTSLEAMAEEMVERDLEQSRKTPSRQHHVD